MSNRQSVDEIQKAIDSFTKGLPNIDKKQYDKVYAQLKELSLDANGDIKITISNLKIIDKVKNQLASIVDNPIYQANILQLNVALTKVKELQSSYYSQTFKDFTKPKSIDKIQKLAFESTADQLAGAGIQENVVNISTDIVEKHIREGSSFRTMTSELEKEMIGNGAVPSRLIRYSKQVINDTMSGFARNYHAIVTNDLELEWFMYVGALVASSRPMCIVLVAKQYIHKSELAGIARGVVNGFPVSREGFMPDTTGENFVFRCAGFNCEHQCVPIPSVVVPKELRDKFDKAS